MSNVCVCEGTFKNTGNMTRNQIISDGVKMIVVQLVADDGTRNAIAVGDTLDAAYFTAKFENADLSKRWYPIGNFENVDDTRADPVTETFTSGGSAINQQGVRTFLGWLVGIAPAYKARIESFKCNKIGVYAVDKCGNLIGSVSKDGTKLYPIAVNEQSWYAHVVKASAQLSGKVELRFEFSQLESDASLRVILESSMANDVDLVNEKGLLDATPTISSITTTGFTAALVINYDAFIDPLPVKGLVAGDFDVYNTTTAAAVTVLTATESPDGTYALTFAAQTPADVLRLKGIANGFEIEETLITIP